MIFSSHSFILEFQYSSGLVCLLKLSWSTLLWNSSTCCWQDERQHSIVSLSRLGLEQTFDIPLSEGLIIRSLHLSRAVIESIIAQSRWSSSCNSGDWRLRDSSLQGSSCVCPSPGGEPAEDPGREFSLEVRSVEVIL